MPSGLASECLGVLATLLWSQRLARAHDSLLPEHPFHRLLDRVE